MILTKCIVEEEDHDKSSLDDSINEEEKELETLIQMNLKSKTKIIFIFHNIIFIINRF